MSDETRRKRDAAIDRTEARRKHREWVNMSVARARAGKSDPDRDAERERRRVRQSALDEADAHDFGRWNDL